MTEHEFQHNARAAETLRHLAQEPDEQEFWTGYVRGLSRNYHGEQFGTTEEHALWMATADSDDQGRRMTRLGYRAGFEGLTVRTAMGDLRRAKSKR